MWDFGGVILTSPFDAFAEYEREAGLPEGLIRRINATNPDDNAWAKLERAEVDIAGFMRLFEAEAEALGHPVDAQRVVDALSGALRPEMVEALRRIHERGVRQAMITNNFVVSGDHVERDQPMDAVAPFLELVVESSKAGVRKPDPAIYRMACDQLGVEPSACVFLDDLGINLKPARAMGMQTIKVLSADQALTDLEAVLGFPLR